MAKEKPEAKKAPLPMRAPESGLGEAKTPRPSTASSGGGAKAAPPVDILGDDSPILSSAPLPIEQLSVPLSAKIPKQAPKNPPVSTLPRPQTSAGGPSSAAAMEQQNAAFKPAIVKKSTMEVLNDTTASLSGRSRNIDEHLAKTSALNAAASVERGSVSASTTTTKVGRAVPFSGSSRPNVPEEEVITVKKQESKKPEHESDDAAAEGKQTAEVPGDAKQAKAQGFQNHHQLHFDDSLDDVEEIPFLEEAKPEPKLVEKMEAKKVEASDDNPIIEVENKHAAPKPSSGASHRASTNGNSSQAPLQQGDAKDNEHKSSNNNNNYYEDTANDDDALLSTRRESSHEDIYDELRKLKRSSPRLDDDSGDPTLASSSSGSNSSHNVRKESVDEGDAKDATSSSSRDKSREKRKEKRRSKLDDEPKKIQAQVHQSYDILLSLWTVQYLTKLCWAMAMPLTT